MKKRVTLFLALIFSAAFAQSVYAYDFEVKSVDWKGNTQVFYCNIVSEGIPNDKYNLEFDENGVKWNDWNPEHNPSATCELTYKSVVEQDGKLVYNSDYGDLTTMEFIANVVVNEGKRYKIVGVGAHAFENCQNLVFMKIPEFVSQVGACAFKDCKLVDNVQLTENCNEYPDSAFYGCEGLKTITISYYQNKIGDAAFWGCTNLNMIYVGAYRGPYISKFPNLEIGNDAFYHQVEMGKKCTVIVSAKDKDHQKQIEEQVKDVYPWNKFNVIVGYWVTQGVEDVEVSQDAPVEYYNLQGVRLAQPEAGQVVVKRQGGTATKMIVK